MWKVVLIVEAAGFLFVGVLGYVLLPLLPERWLVTGGIGAVAILFVGTLVYFFR